MLIKATPVDTATCPRCQKLINSQAVTCRHCGFQLKAYGHPGIPLHRAKEKEYLCDNCTYNADDTCNFPQRPFAKECILYQNVEENQLDLQQRSANSFNTTVKNWMRRNQALLLLLALLFICLVIALSTT